MTVIAHFNSFGCSTLIGDLLVSGDEAPARPVHIPVSQNINERVAFNRGRYVVGLAQKIVLISPVIAVAWSGSYSQACELFSVLQPLQRVTEVDPEYVQSVIEQLDDSMKNKLSLIVAVASAKSSRITTHGVQPAVDFGPISDVTCAGSGRFEFVEIIRQLAQNIVTENPRAAVSELRQGFDLTLLGALAGEEFVSPVPLLRGWGGGFELARLEGGHFKKQRNQLLLNFYVEREQEGLVLWWTPHFRHVDYWGSATVVQAIEHEVTPSGDLLPGRRDVFIVTPPGASSADLSQFSPADVHSQELVVVHILVPDARAVTYAASYELPVLRYEAPIGTTSVSASIDGLFLRDLIDGLSHRLAARIRFGGYKDRSGR